MLADLQSSCLTEFGQNLNENFSVSFRIVLMCQTASESSVQTLELKYSALNLRTCRNLKPASPQFLSIIVTIYFF